MNDHGPDADDTRPLPRHWLPDPVAPPGESVWDAELRRIMAAVEPTMAAIDGGHRTPAGDARAARWPAALGVWWKGAAALAAAAAVLLLLMRPALTRGIPATPAGVLPLSVLAAAAEPASLWRGLGIDADPVLAAIVQEQMP